MIKKEIGENNMNGNRIIVHTLISVNNKYLVIKRSKEEKTFPDGIYLVDLLNIEKYPKMQ